ncbi:MAG: DUF6788 family protein [Terriglobia bacterium]
MTRKRLPTERQLRQRLARVIKTAPLAHATLSSRSRVCGKPRCCCTRGKLHTSLYLVRRKGGQFHQLCVSRERERWARRAVLNYRKALELIEQLSGHAWAQANTRKR